VERFAAAGNSSAPPYSARSLNPISMLFASICRLSLERSRRRNPPASSTMSGSLASATDVAQSVETMWAVAGGPALVELGPAGGDPDFPHQRADEHRFVFDPSNVSDGIGLSPIRFCCAVGRSLHLVRSPQQERVSVRCPECFHRSASAPASRFRRALIRPSNRVKASPTSNPIGGDSLSGVVSAALAQRLKSIVTRGI
jgi:hypothetical protein